MAHECTHNTHYTQPEMHVHNTWVDIQGTQLHIAQMYFTVTAAHECIHTTDAHPYSTCTFSTCMAQVPCQSTGWALHTNARTCTNT